MPDHRVYYFVFFFSSRRRHTRLQGDWSSDVCSSDLGLSDREMEVFQLIGQWKKTREIAEELHLSIKTIEYYREQIKRKLNLKSASELTHYATSWVQREQPS